MGLQPDTLHSFPCGEHRSGVAGCRDQRTSMDLQKGMDAMSRRFSLVPLIAVLLLLFLTLWFFGFI